MLDATLGRIRPGQFALDGDATEMDGLVEGWFTFATAHTRAQGCVRLVDGRAWTLLIAVTQLMDYPEAAGRIRPLGTVHTAQPNRPNWLERRHEHEARLGHEDNPYGLILGGGQAGSALAARLKQLDVPTLLVERNQRARATPGATAIAACACTPRSGTSICRISASRRTGRCSRPRTRWATGWKCIRA